MVGGAERAVTTSMRDLRQIFGCSYRGPHAGSSQGIPGLSIRIEGAHRLLEAFLVSTDDGRRSVQLCCSVAVTSVKTVMVMVMVCATSPANEWTVDTLSKLFIVVSKPVMNDCRLEVDKGVADLLQAHVYLFSGLSCSTQTQMLSSCWKSIPDRPHLE